MKISVGRSGRDIGDFELEDVRAGLVRGLFLSSDFGWYPGMKKWLPVMEVIKEIDHLLSRRKISPPTERGWRKEKATDKQIKMLRRAGVAVPAGLTRGRASDLIAALPEPYKRFTGKEIEILLKHGLNLNTATMLECYVVLEKPKA